MAVELAFDTMVEEAAGLASYYQSQRDLLFQGLFDLGYQVMKPEGSYFLLAQSPSQESAKKQVQTLIEKARVACLPVNGLPLTPPSGQHWLRFCFAKKRETLLTALDRLGKFRHHTGR